jgi:hypothetical protein
MICVVKMKVLFANITGFYTFASVKGDPLKNGLNEAVKIYRNPQRGGRHPQISVGSLFLRHAVRAKLWFTRSLVQVNSVLDERKPRGRLIFFMGVFFFCFPLFKVLNTFCFLLFSFE